MLFWITDAAREKDDAILPACIAEMEAHRRQLMNDFQISPELVVKCAKDIQVCHANLIRRGYNKVSGQVNLRQSSFCKNSATITMRFISREMVNAVIKAMEDKQYIV